MERSREVAGGIYWGKKKRVVFSNVTIAWMKPALGFYIYQLLVYIFAFFLTQVTLIWLLETICARTERQNVIFQEKAGWQTVRGQLDREADGAEWFRKANSWGNVDLQGRESGWGVRAWDAWGLAGREVWGLETGWFYPEIKSGRQMVLLGPDNSISFGFEIIFLLRSSRCQTLTFNKEVLQILVFWAQLPLFKHMCRCGRIKWSYRAVSCRNLRPDRSGEKCDSAAANCKLVQADLNVWLWL